MKANRSRISKPGQATWPAQQPGFSYIGLLIFVAILGVMSASAVSTGSTLERRSQEVELLFIGSQFREAFKSYYDDTPAGQLPYPKSLAELVKDDRFPQPRRHLRKIFVDPMTGRTDWGLVPAPGGGIAGVFSLSSGKPIKTAKFPAEFADFEGKENYSEWVFGQAPVPLVNQAAVQHR